MFQFGVYKNRLYKFLLPAGILTLVMVAGLLGHFFTCQQKNSYLHYLSASTATLEGNSRIAMTVLSRAINHTLGNSSLAAWADARTRNQFYFASIAAQKQLQVITADSPFINYDLAVTTLHPKKFPEGDVHMVLKKTGSTSAEDFFIKEKGLGQNQVREIFHHFSFSGDPMALPHYVGHQLDSIYYVVKTNFRPEGLLCFVTIPAKVLAGNSGANSYLVHGQGRAIAYSSDQPASVAFLNHLMEKIRKQGEQEYFPCQNKYVFTTSIPSMGWHVAYVHDTFMLKTSQVLAFLAFSAVVLMLLLFMVSRLVEALYRPVKEAVYVSLDHQPQAKAPIDEFKIMRQNSEKIKALGKSLQKALDEKQQLACQQQCRKLLYSPAPAQGLPPGFEDPGSWFYVALVEFFHSQEGQAANQIMIQKEVLHGNVMNAPGLTYVDLDHHRCGLILKDKKAQEAEACLRTLLAELGRQPGEPVLDQRMALSGLHQGAGQLHAGYQEALRTLEYKHLYNQTKVLSFRQVASLDAVTCSYSLATENRLVHLCLEGKEEALQLFDQLIRTNLMGKALSSQSLQSFVFALIGTVGRMFQELKSSPESLLAEEIDFKRWYDHWSDSVTITQIRQAIQNTLAAVNRKNKGNDQELLNQMVAYIHENYGDDIMLYDMADQFNISPKYCGILFKQLSGHNFKDYLNRYRVEKAKEFLEENPEVKIGDLSHMVGFNSANSFIRVFGKYTGLTPKAYTERMGA